MIRAVIFDFDGTLVDFVESDIAVLKYIHGLAGMNYAADQFIDAAVDGILQFHDLVDSGKIDPLLMNKYRLSCAFEKVGMDLDNRFVNLYKLQLLRETEAYPGVNRLLSDLTGRVKLGLITNAYDGVLQRNRIEASGLSRFFAEILIAGEVGVAKPDPEIFLLMSRKLNVPPEECLFIGDSAYYDIAGADSAGMRTVLYGAKGADIQDLTLLIENHIAQEPMPISGDDGIGT